MTFLSEIKGRQSLFYFLASLLISILLVWYLLSQIKFQDLLRAFNNLYLPGLGLYILLALGGVVARTYRYSLLIGSSEIGIVSLVLVTLIRNLFVDLLPARIGSLSYIYLLNKRFGFPFEVAASTFLIAFIFDFLVVFPLLFLALIATRINPFFLSNTQILLISFLLFIFLMALIFYLDRLLKILANFFRWGLGKLRKGENPRIKFLIEKLLLTAEDVKSIKTRKVYTKVFLSSFAIRIFKYSSLYFLLYAVLVHLNFTLNNLNFWKVFLGILGAEFSALLPIHGIAGLGTWEAAWVFTFKLLGFFNPQVAIISGFSVHIITQIFEYSLGILAILILALPFLKSSRKIGI